MTTEGLGSGIPNKLTRKHRKRYTLEKLALNENGPLKREIDKRKEQTHIQRICSFSIFLKV